MATVEQSRFSLVFSCCCRYFNIVSEFMFHVSVYLFFFILYCLKSFYLVIIGSFSCFYYIYVGGRVKI